MTKTKLKAGLVQQDPPAGRVQVYDWAAIAAQVESQAGTWFKVFEQDKTSYSVAIRNGDIAALRSELGFEMRTANNTRGRTKGTNGSDDPGEARTCSLFLRFDPKRKRKTPPKKKETT